MTDQSTKIPPIAEQKILIDQETQTDLTHEDIKKLEDKLAEQTEAQQSKKTINIMTEIKNWICKNCGWQFNAVGNESCDKCGWFEKYNN